MFNGPLHITKCIINTNWSFEYQVYIKPLVYLVCESLFIYFTLQLLFSFGHFLVRLAVCLSLSICLVCFWDQSEWRTQGQERLLNIIRLLASGALWDSYFEKVRLLFWKGLAYINRRLDRTIAGLQYDSPGRPQETELDAVWPWSTTVKYMYYTVKYMYYKYFRLVFEFSSRFSKCFRVKVQPFFFEMRL